MLPVFFQTLLKIVGQLFTEERDVRLAAVSENEETGIRNNMITFIIQGGNRGSSSSSSLSSLLRRFGTLLVAFLETFPDSLQLLHRGTSPCIISCSIALPGTRMRHSRQEAVAKDP
jgi:hypothetical protein